MRRFCIAVTASMCIMSANAGDTLPPGYDEAPRMARSFEYAMIGPQKTIIAGHAVGYIQEENRIGVYDFDGNELIEPKYIWIDPIEKYGMQIFVGINDDSTKEPYYLDGDVMRRIPLSLEYVAPGPGNCVIAGHSEAYFDPANRVGLYDLNGNEVVKPIYSLIEPIESSGALGYMATDALENRCILTKDGSMLMSLPMHTDVRQIGDESFIASKMIGGKLQYVVMDADGNELFVAPLDILPLQDTCDRIIFVDNNTNKYGVMSRSGEVVLPATYEMIGPFSEGLAVAFQKGVASDKEIEEGVTVNVYPAGFIDTSGHVAIPFKFKYESAGNLEYDTVSFSEGLCLMNDNGKWGYVDHTGDAAIPFRYFWATPFIQGRAIVDVPNDDDAGREEGYPYRTICIDTKGNEVDFPSPTEDEVAFEYDHDSSDNPDKYGIVRVGDSTHEWVCPPIFEDSADYYESFTTDGYNMVKFRGMENIIDRKGRVLLRDVSKENMRILIPG